MNGGSADYTLHLVDYRIIGYQNKDECFDDVLNDSCIFYVHVFVRRVSVNERIDTLMRQKVKFFPKENFL